MLVFCLGFGLMAAAQDSETPKAAGISTDAPSTTENVTEEAPPATKFPTPTAQTIKNALDAVEADSDLSDQEKAPLLEQYRKAQELLKSAETDRQAAEAQKKLNDTAPERLKTLQTQLTELTSTNAPELTLPEGITKDSDLSKLRDALKQETTRLETLKQQRTQIDATTSRLRTLPEDHTRQKLEAEASLAKTDAAIQTETEESANEAEGKARVAVLMSQKLALENKLKRLAEEAAGRDQSVEINNVARELNTRRISRVEKTVALIKEWVDTKAAAEAKAAELAAIQAEQEARLKHPVIRMIAATNTYFASKLNEVTAINTDLSRSLTELDAELERDTLAFTNLSSQYEVAGLSETIAELLLSEGRQLPKIDDLKKRRTTYKAILTTNTLAHIVISSRLNRLATIEDEAQQILDSVEGMTEAEKAELLPDVTQLLDQQKQTLKKLRDAFDTTERHLGELDRKEAEYIKLVTDFTSFIDERLLWSPNAPVFSLGTLIQARDDFKKLIDSENLAAVFEAFATIFKTKTFLAWLCVVLPLVIVALRSRFTAFHSSLQSQTKRVRTDRFSLSLRALIATIFEISPYYIVTQFFGKSLRYLEDAPMYVSSFGFALERSVHLVMPFILLIAICRPNGLGEGHFKWPPDVTRALRRPARHYMLVAWACFFVIAWLVADQKTVQVGGLGRICYIISALLLTFYVWRLFQPTRGRFWGVIDQSTRGLILRTRILWYPFALLMPVFLAGLAVAGYVVTAVVLNMHLNRSFYFLLCVVVIYQLTKRWFLIRQRRAAVTYELERRRAAAEEAAKASESGSGASDRHDKIEIEEPEIDYDAVKMQTMELMVTIATLIFVIGLWFIWSDVVPALGYLDKFEFWQSSRMVDGTPQLVPVTLGDLLAALAVFIAAIVGYRNLPSLLDVAVLQNTKLLPGSRYAIKTLSQYTLFVIGVFIVMSRLGVNWSQLGWMAAALSVGLGFGLQEVVANFVCGILLFVERPVRVGDVVTVSDVTGTVVRIQIRATTIMDWDRREYVVPNKEFIAGRILNWTLSNSVNRLVIKTGVAYGSDTEKACELMVEAARENPNVMDDPPPFAVFEDFADSSLALTLRCYLPDVNNRLSAQHDIRTAIDRKFKEAGIEIPFPQRDLHLRSVDNSLKWPESGRHSEGGESAAR